MLAVVGLVSAFVGPSTIVPASPMRASAAAMSARTIPDKNVWVDMASAADIPAGTVGSGFRYGQEIAIANVGGALYGVANKLPPTGQPATFASIEKLNGQPVIVEPVSGSCFSLKSGKPVGPWCPSVVGRFLLKFLVSPQDVPTYPVRKSGNKIQALINVNAKAQFETNYWRGVLDAQGKVDGGYY